MDATAYWKSYVAASANTTPQSAVAAAPNEKEEKERAIQLWVKGIPNELRMAVWLARLKECGKEAGDCKFEFNGNGPALSEDVREEITLQLDSFQSSASDFQMAEPDMLKVKRILLVHAAKNGRDTYLQGSAQLVSRLLMLLDRNESHAYAVFSLVSQRMRLYLRDDHLSLRNDILVLADVLTVAMPELAKSLNDNMFDVVDLCDIITVWIDGMCANHFSKETVARAIDIVLFDGPQLLTGLMLGLLGAFRASLVSQHNSTLFQFVTDIPSLTKPSHLETALRFGYDHYRSRHSVPLVPPLPAPVQPTPTLPPAAAASSNAALKSPAPKVNNFQLASISERDSKSTPGGSAPNLLAREGELNVLRRSKDWVRCLGSKRFARLMFVKDVGDPQRMVLPKEGVYFEDMEFEAHRRGTTAGSPNGYDPLRTEVGSVDIPAGGRHHSHTTAIAAPQSAPHHTGHHHHHGGHHALLGAPPSLAPLAPPPGGGGAAGTETGQHPTGGAPHHPHTHTHQQTQQFLLSRTTMDLSNPDHHLHGHHGLPHSHSKSDLLKHARPPSPMAASGPATPATGAGAGAGGVASPLPLTTPTHIHATANAAYVNAQSAAATTKQAKSSSSAADDLHDDEDPDHKKWAEPKKRLLADAVAAAGAKRSPTNAATTLAPPAGAPAITVSPPPPPVVIVTGAGAGAATDDREQEIENMTSLLVDINRKLAEKHALVTALQAELKKRDELDSARRRELDDKQKQIQTLQQQQQQAQTSSTPSGAKPPLPTGTPPPVGGGGADSKAPSLPPLPPLLGLPGGPAPLLPALSVPPLPAVLLTPPVIPNDGIVKYSELHYHLRLPCLFHEGYLLKATELALDAPTPPGGQVIIPPPHQLHRRFFTIHGPFVTYFQSHINKTAPTKDRSIDMRGRRLFLVNGPKPPTSQTSASASGSGGGAAPASTAITTEFGFQIQRIDSKRPAVVEQCLYQLFCRTSQERDVWVRVLSAATQLK